MRRQRGCPSIRSDHRSIWGEKEGSWVKKLILSFLITKMNRWLKHMKFTSKVDYHVPQRKENGSWNPWWKVQEELKWAEQRYVHRSPLIPPPNTPASTSLTCCFTLAQIPRDGTAGCHPAGAKNQSHSLTAASVSFSRSWKKWGTQRFRKKCCLEEQEEDTQSRSKYGIRQKQRQEDVARRVRKSGWIWLRERTRQSCLPVPSSDCSG